MSKLDKNGKPIYNKDGKVIKGPKYFKPNLESILNNDNQVILRFHYEKF